jgi:hypothetical protein
MGEWIYRSTFFLTSALAVGEWSASRFGRFTPGTHWIGSWVDPRSGLDDENIPAPTRTRTPTPLGRARSHSRYRLHYPGSHAFVDAC